MKWLVREQLAPWLRVTVLSKTPMSSPVSSRQDNNDAGDFQQDGPQLEDVTSGTTDKLMLIVANSMGLSSCKFWWLATKYYMLGVNQH